MKILKYAVILSICIISCRKPYAPPATHQGYSYLVVEGLINISTDSTIIKLSRTVKISSEVTTNPELRAQVTVEGDNNTNYPLTELSDGRYGAAGTSLDLSHKYRLRVQTANNEVYLSSFERALNTPPIDSVGFNILNNLQNPGLQIYVNTHDPTGVIKYFRWDYAEAWKFTAFHHSDFITDGIEIVPRTPDQYIDTCYTSDSSSTIVLGSSAGLSKAAIYESPITQIPSTSEKIESKYCIEVNQYALNSEAYNFWLNVKKNTEQLGSIFDAQPSILKGNIQCLTNPSQPVIGYISVASIQRKRVYILKEQLPQWTPANAYGCGLADSSLFIDNKFVPPQNDVAVNLIPLGSALIPTIGIYQDRNLIGYFSAPNSCVDCTLRGKKKPPAFWK